ncbi:MFS transporter [Mycobacterium sp. AMU20-3851]|uniref:MFS transporter n=1 Tax=Mycobacterium sp. AMU20-3851 TaxID=3122055 RepID=UPI00375495CB
MGAWIDLSKTIDTAPVSALQRRTIVLLVILAILDGFDAMMLGYAVPSIARDWEVGTAEFGVVLSASAAAMVFGSILFGSLSDRFGRRRVILAGTLLFSIFTLLTAFAESMPVLIALRIVTGLALGGVTPNLIAMASEFTPKRIRGTVVTILVSAMSMGGFVGGLTAATLIPSYGWKALFIVGGGLPLVVALVAVRLLPESIAFVSMSGNREKCVELLRALDPQASVTADAKFVYASDEAPEKASVTRLFAPGRATATLAVWGIFFINYLILYFLMGWMPTLFEGAGMSTALASTAVALFALGGVVGGISLGRVADRLSNPARVAMGSYLLAAAFILVTAAVMGVSTGLTLLGVFVVGVGVLGSLAIMNVIAATIYPTSIRGSGVGWALGIGRLGSISGPAAGAIALAIGLGASTIFSVMAIPAILAVALLATVARGQKPSTPRDSELSI